MKTNGRTVAVARPFVKFDVLRANTTRGGKAAFLGFGLGVNDFLVTDATRHSMLPTPTSSIEPQCDQESDVTRRHEYLRPTP